MSVPTRHDLPRAPWKPTQADIDALPDDLRSWVEDALVRMESLRDGATAADPTPSHKKPSMHELARALSGRCKYATATAIECFMCAACRTYHAILRAVEDSRPR